MSETVENVVELAPVEVSVEPANAPKRERKGVKAPKAKAAKPAKAKAEKKAAKPAKATKAVKAPKAKAAAPRQSQAGHKAQANVHPQLWKMIQQEAKSQGVRDADVVREAIERRFKFKAPEAR